MTAKPESSKFNAFWMPDQVRHDDFETFYEIVNVALKKYTFINDLPFVLTMYQFWDTLCNKYRFSFFNFQIFIKVRV